MALLLPGGHLGGLGGSADGAGKPVEGASAPPIVRDGLGWGLKTGETDRYTVQLQSSKSCTRESARGTERKAFMCQPG